MKHHPTYHVLSFLGVLLYAALFSSCSKSSTSVQFEFDSSNPQYQLGVDKIVSSLGEQKLTSVSFVEDSTLGCEAYQLDVSSEHIRIVGGDSNGVMYGAFELAEQIRQRGVGAIVSKSEAPKTDFRAIKFNLPWDSYRRNPALQLHMQTCRDLKYWEKFLNMMAENRFNALTLWNLHPFPYLVCPKSFPEVWEGKEEEMKRWQQFYHDLFKLAKDRGIETYIVNWNIFVDEAISENYGDLDGNVEHHFWGDGEDSELIRKYTRECVTQVIDEYPNLTGLGFSLGERMGGFSPVEREEWALDVIVAGIRDAKRKIKLIHRVPFSANKKSGGSTDVETEMMTREAMESIDCVEDPIWVEIKFNWSHAHSSPKLVKVHGGSIKDTYWNPVPENYKITWMIRNEDFFCLRWGAPDFIREHIAMNSQEYVGGYFIGSECYIPGVDYFTKHDGPVNWEYAFERQWAYYQQWGRLLYNPNTSNEVFQGAYVEKYGEKGTSLQRAYELASQMPLLHGSYFDVAWDFTLYSEGFLSTWPGGPTRQIDLDRLINGNTLDPDYLNVADYVRLNLAGEDIYDRFITPVELAHTLDQNATDALKLIEGIDFGNNVALFYELADIKIWSELSRYFAEKLRAGICYEEARLTKDAEKKATSLKHMEQAVKCWERVVELTEPIYKEMPLVHMNNRKDGVYFHWEKELDDVKLDLQYIENLKL